MNRTELQNELKKLGCKRMCYDGKTLQAYYQIRNFLYANKTPIKAITNVYLDDDGNTIRVVLYDDIDLDSGYMLRG